MANSTTNPCRTAAERQPEVEQYDGKANWDPDKLVQCPFDKNHQIRSCRFICHLFKCAKNHPEVASELKTCPFNARHLVPEDELAHHTETCDYRVDSGDGGDANEHRAWHVPVSTWENPNMTEDWDQEAEDNPTPFVWSVNLLAPKLGPRPTSKPSHSLRLPKNLPWADDIKAAL